MVSERKIQKMAERGDLRGLQRVGDQHLHVVAPADDVNSLARQLINDVLDPISADTNARPHTIDARISTADRDFAAIARFSGDGPHLDHLLGDLRDLLLKQPLDQLRASTAEDDLDPAALLADVKERRADTLVGMM